MKLIFQKDPREGSKEMESIFLEEERTRIKERKKTRMKSCANHYQAIVVFEGDDCPFCKMEKIIRAIGEEADKAMAIMQPIPIKGKEAGLKSDSTNNS